MYFYKIYASYCIFFNLFATFHNNFTISLSININGDNYYNASSKGININDYYDQNDAKI